MGGGKKEEEAEEGLVDLENGIKKEEEVVVGAEVDFWTVILGGAEVLEEEDLEIGIKTGMRRVRKRRRPLRKKKRQEK